MDVVCYSHLRWNFVYQRPQHIISRFAQQFRTFCVEEPVFDATKPFLESLLNDQHVWVITPHLAPSSPEDNIIQQKKLLFQLFNQFRITDYVAWFYTPMALELTTLLPPPLVVVYDCMDELSAFKNAPSDLPEKETALLKVADVVFTGGFTLFEAKRGMHRNIHPFPSSIDKQHFAKARLSQQQPSDQESIPHPRLGFFGVIDERMDIDLLVYTARSRPDWQIVLVGPVVKIDPATLPRLDNIHYLGGKSYNELPAYLSGWDVALLPFAINESTKFISPTKTPEYLAGGKPVVSTPINDVINPYGKHGLVCIAHTPAEFVEGIEQALQNGDSPQWLKAVDAFLENISWDRTWEQMLFHINSVLETRNADLKQSSSIKKERANV